MKKPSHQIKEIFTFTLKKMTVFLCIQNLTLRCLATSLSMPHQGRKPDVILSFHIHALWDQIRADVRSTTALCLAIRRKSELSGEGDVTNWCQTVARWNPLLKIFTQEIYCHIFVSNQPPYRRPCMSQTESITQHLITVVTVLTSETAANNQTPADKGITLLTPCTAFTSGCHWQINHRGVASLRLIISHVL